MLWVVSLFPCEWDGQVFHIPVWAIATCDGLLKGVEPEQMDTAVSWGHRYIHCMQESGKKIDGGFIEAVKNVAR